MSTVSDTEKTDRPRSRKGAATRARLLDAAKAVFEDVGFLDARVSDIADRAGMSHGSFYHYFDSKDQVFREVTRSISGELSSGMAIILDSESKATTEERVVAALRLHFEGYRKEAKMMGVIEQVSRHDENLARMRSNSRIAQTHAVADSIRKLQQRGMADDSVDATVAAAALGAMTGRFAEQWLIHGDPECDFDDGVEQVAKLWLNALQLRSGSVRRTRSAVPRQRGAGGG